MPKPMIAVLGGTLAVVVFLVPVQAQNPSAVLPRSGIRSPGGLQGGPVDAVKNISNLPTLQPSPAPVTNAPPAANLPTLQPSPAPVTNAPPVTSMLPIPKPEMNGNLSGNTGTSSNLPALKLEPNLIHITNDERFLKPVDIKVLTNENNSIRIVSPSSVPSP
jgi:hypothetical protein